MIRFSNEHIEPLIRQMWKVCFEDTEAFINLIFTQKYRPENTLVYFENDMAVASLQMHPYTISFYGEEIPFAYLAGLCTLPEYRNKGYMAQLINKAHQILEDRNIPLAILIPAEDWLFRFYEKFDYEQVFDKSEEPIYSLNKILAENPDLESAYSSFDSLYRHKDFCVQKSFEDFKTIVEEYKNDKFPEKYNLAGMARTIDNSYLLKLFAIKNPSLSIRIKTEGQAYLIDKGTIGETQEDSDIEINRRMLCRLLFGYKTNELDKPLQTIFAEHHSVMNLMLE
ncbi:MAG: GNAT family N-acetyltransferase [Dysgonomonas sp.]